MITLVIMTDGRKIFLEPTIKSAEKNLIGPITRRIIHDDSADPAFSAWLHKEYSNRYEIVTTGRRSGFGGAIISAWNTLRDDENGWIFHLEDDFVFNETVPLVEIANVMAQNPHIVQMALRRQPWNDAERAAGGIVESDPDSYTEKDNGIFRWVEHRKFFTTNPSLYRRSLTVEHPWPAGNNSEGMYGINLFSNPEYHSAYWGPKVASPKVTHIGEYRNGAGY